MPLYLRWPSVVVALILFWPLGLWLIGIRLGRNEMASLKVGQWLLGGGSLLSCIGGMALLTAFVGSDDDPGGRQVLITASILLGLVPGLILIWKGHSLRARGRKIRQYVELIINQESVSLSAISASLQIGQDLVLSDLARLIAEGNLAGHYLNRERNTIDRVSSQPQQRDGCPLRLRSWTCETCGGFNNRHLPACEYCGTVGAF
jgi:hypothetical protein